MSAYSLCQLSNSKGRNVTKGLYLGLFICLGDYTVHLYFSTYIVPVPVFMRFNMNFKFCMIVIFKITNSLFLCICLYLLDVPGEQIQEGKTKIIYEHSENTVYVLSKDRISANNAQRVNDLEGKAAISTATTCKVFEFLEQTGKEQMFSCFKSPNTEPLNGERCLLDL